MILLAQIALVFMLVRLAIVFFNAVTRPALPAAIEMKNDLISVLIPARDEEENIGRLLEQVLAQDYPALEVIVYDDESGDDTARIVERAMQSDKRVRLIHGEGLPSGWLGKNHACHQLALQANGNLLLFLDADSIVSAGLMRDAADRMARHKLDLLSLFPVQEMRSLGEWLTVPLMNWILLTLLGLKSVRHLKSQAFSAANGQFMLFRRETYLKYHFHRMVKDRKVEDILIVKIMKSEGIAVETLLSSGQVGNRMYSGYTEAVQGFSKNIRAFFIDSWFLLFGFVFITTAGPLFIFLSFGTLAMAGYLSGIVLIRVTVSMMSRQSWWLNVLLMPLQQLTLVLISLNSLYRDITGTLRWKGRRISR